MCAGGFASTQWSVVLLAGGARTAPQVREALARLCSTYWYPLYAFIRRQGHSADDAEDLTQEFFARFLDKDFLSTVDQNRGKFRTFLLACCQHFLANQRDFARAQKRGGGRPVLSLDFPGAADRYCAEPASDETAEKLFRAVLGADHPRSGAGAIAAGVSGRRQKRTVRPSQEVPRRWTGCSFVCRDRRQLGMNEDAVRKAAQRLRQRYRSVLRERIADTVDEPARIDDEIRDLFAALAS